MRGRGWALHQPRKCSYYSDCCFPLQPLKVKVGRKLKTSSHTIELDECVTVGCGPPIHNTLKEAISGFTLPLDEWWTWNGKLMVKMVHSCHSGRQEKRPTQERNLWGGTVNGPGLWVVPPSHFHPLLEIVLLAHLNLIVSTCFRWNGVGGSPTTGAEDLQ